MKGTIHYCLEETILDQYGREAWNQCKLAAGIPKEYSFGQQILDDLNEEDTIKLFIQSADTLDIDLKSLFDQFGIYWCCTYAPNLYPQFFQKARSTKEMLLGLDHIHQIVTSKKPGAKPPRFTYDWLDDGRLLVNYQSERGLFELFESLLRGLDHKFGSHTQIERTDDNGLILAFEA
ncbi:heme NO-binding domain-containing protein [Marinoscillum sp.]|uniref:heme NO-binding domain-containing protein n=1 Tax=Marinoscillum sp. TaxID=2024838 RepID=UPI003BACC83B